VLGFQWAAIERQSLVGDAPYHLLAGHQALRYGENRLNLEHPPLVKMVAALPLLWEEPLAPPVTVENVLEHSLRIFDDPGRLERVTRASRLLVLLFFGLPFLAACWALGNRLGGPPVGTVLMLLLGLAPPALPNLAILQTDTALALGFTLSLLTGLAYIEGGGAGRAAVFGLALGLALATKLSAVLLAPTALLVGLWAPGPWRRRLLLLGGIGALALLTAYLPYAVANRNYDPEAGRDTLRRYCRGEALIVDDALRPYEEPLLAVERIDPNLAQWLTGLLGVRAQNSLGVYPSYAFGELTSTGRWWYFPAVFGVRTPLLVLLALATAAFLALGRKRVAPSLAPVLTNKSRAVLGLTAGVYLFFAMGSNYNLGIRHLLPILPVLYLPAAWLLARRPPWAVGICALLALESLLLAPLWMSATNTWWLGSANPTRFALSAGAIEYRQNFRILAHEMETRGIETPRVAFPLVDDREIHAYLPAALPVNPDLPPEPGWYAVSILLEQYLPTIPRTPPDAVRGHASLLALAEHWTPFWDAVRAGEDHGYVAGTFHLYYLPPDP
jgi:hypothetical protein